MAWCPKCKNEYRKGITVCAECGCELVEEDQSKKQVPIIFGQEVHLNGLKKFLAYNGIENVAIIFEESKQVHVLLVNEEEKEKALKIAKVYMDERVKEEQQRRAMENAGIEVPTQEAEQEEEESDRVFVPGGSYLNSAQKAEDNRSSAWTLLLVGGIGMVIMVLGMLDLLPFKVGNPYMFYGVMSAVFILFIVMGFVSMKNAKFFAKNAESENTLKNTLLEWCKENLKADQIDSKIQYAGEIGEEELYLRRYEIIKFMINHQFMNLDQGLVERLIDDDVYDMVFSDGK